MSFIADSVAANKRSKGMCLRSRHLFRFSKASSIVFKEEYGIQHRHCRSDFIFDTYWSWEGSRHHSIAQNRYASKTKSPWWCRPYSLGSTPAAKMKGTQTNPIWFYLYPAVRFESLSQNCSHPCVTWQASRRDTNCFQMCYRSCDRPRSDVQQRE